jgi:hypothetical protein
VVRFIVRLPSKRRQRQSPQRLWLAANTDMRRSEVLGRRDN